MALFVVAASWGSSYLAAKVATGVAPVPVVLLLRYGLSAVACVLLGGLRGCTRDELRLGVVLGLTQASVLTLETYGVAQTSAANAGLIISMAIVLTPMLAGTRLPASFFAATGVCLVGVTAIMLGNGLRVPGRGDALVLAAAFARAGHVALIGRLTARRAVRPLQLTTVQLLSGTVLFAVPAAPLATTVARLGTSGWFAVAYLALFCSVLAFLVQTIAVQRTSASRASLLLGTEPVWAVVAGVCLGGESLTVAASIGAALVVGGAYWGQAIEGHHRREGTAHQVVEQPLAGGLPR